MTKQRVSDITKNVLGTSYISRNYSNYRIDAHTNLLILRKDQRTIILKIIDIERAQIYVLDV